MTITEYNDCQRLVLRVLKQKYTNMSAEEGMVMATNIINAIINRLGLKQE